MEEIKKLTEDELARVTSGDGEEISDGIIRGGIYRVDEAGLIVLYRPYNKRSDNYFYTDKAEYDAESGMRVLYKMDVYVSAEQLFAAKYLGTVNVWLFEDKTNIKDLGLII